MENKGHEQLRTPPPHSSTTLPWWCFFQCHLLRTKFFSWVYETRALHKSEVLTWPIQGWQLHQGVGWGWRAPHSDLYSLQRAAVGGSLGATPSVLHNLSLENCKFISQKGLWAEMSSKRTNHFLQSLTELRLGGGGCDHRRGAPFTLVQPSCLSTDHCWLGTKRDGAKSGPWCTNGRPQIRISNLCPGVNNPEGLEGGQGLVLNVSCHTDTPTMNGNVR